MGNRDPEITKRIQRARMIERATQVRKCYEEYQPPQIEHAREMLTCYGMRPVAPKRVRGTSCLTIYTEVPA